MPKVLEIKDYKDKQFKIRNVTESEAEIIIYDEIGESFFGEGVTAKSFSQELNEIPKSVKNIYVRINSPGGDVFDGITIYERLKRHNAKITVYVDGLAASIASVIAMAGDEIIMGDGALMMIHKPMAGVYGNSTDMERMIELLDKVEDQIINIYKKKTKMSDSEIAKMLIASNGDGTWLDGEEAKSFGFIDKIEDESNLQIAASMLEKHKKYLKNAPELYSKIQNEKLRDKIKSMKKDVEGFIAR